MYEIKEEQANKIKKRYKLKSMSEETGISQSMLTFIFSKTRPCSKKNAYAITKYLDSEAEISDYFIRAEEGE